MHGVMIKALKEKGRKRQVQHPNTIFNPLPQKLCTSLPKSATRFASVELTKANEELHYQKR